MVDSRRNINRLIAHYQDLQGLRLIPMGLFFGFAALGNFELTPWSDYVNGGVDSSSFGLIVILIALYLAISFAYRRQYGSVVQNPITTKDRVLSIAFVSAFILAVATFRQLSPPVNTIMLVLAAGICYGSMDGSQRIGRLLLGIAVGVFAIMPLFTGKPDAEYFTWFNSVMALCFLSSGIFEHVTFKKLISSINQAVATDG